ncbi:hypothetical protein ACEPPN_006827 [Leptodophora sp. 'Broadleaf-Isolate-01']
MHISRLVFALGLGALQFVAGHTLFMNLFINDIDQGDGTCVRIPMDAHNATNPINDLDRHSGSQGVARVCPVPQGSKLSFQFRTTPDSSPGTIDASHLGPSAVYMKNVGSAIKDPGVGDGWFKIGHLGYDLATHKWCTQTLIVNHGLLSFPVPPDLAGGYYLIRPELLALQDADKNPPNPQFYTGCAQIFLRSNGTALPKDTVRIPGYVGIENASVRFDVYNPVWPYLELGPEVYMPGLSPKRVVQSVERQTEGLLPGNAVVANANWWSVELSPYENEDGCWNSDTCYKTAPPTGSKNCRV